MPNWSLIPSMTTTLAVALAAPRITRLGSTATITNAQTVRVEAWWRTFDPIIIELELPGDTWTQEPDCNRLLGEPSYWATTLLISPCLLPNNQPSPPIGLCHFILPSGAIWRVRAWFCTPPRYEELLVDLSCPADLDHNGSVTIDDLTYFLSQYESATTAADLDDGTGSGTPDAGIDINDLIYFLARYELGC